VFSTGVAGQVQSQVFGVSASVYVASYFITQNPGCINSSFHGTLINHSGQVVGDSKFRLLDSVVSGHHSSTQLSVFIVVFDMYELYVTQLCAKNKSMFVVI
jgi:hypothetical protein